VPEGTRDVVIKKEDIPEKVENTEVINPN